MTSTFSTTPTMMWSTQYRTANTARRTPTTAPAIGATTTPRYGERVREATTAARKAPASNWPSMAILMTPARSQIVPDNAPKISGTDRASAPASSAVSGITVVRPDPTTTRKDSTKTVPNTRGTHSEIG